jgi:single-strand DNA-binding protein
LRAPVIVVGIRRHGAADATRAGSTLRHEPGRIGMINEAQVFLAGYVATEPTCRTTTRGKPEAHMRVGYTPRRLDRETGEWADGPTSFVSVKCWGKLADNVAVCLRKGEPVVVMGRIQVRPYEKDGAQRLSVDVYATSIGYDLARGVARFARTRPSSGETASERQGAGVSAADSGCPDDDDLAELAYRRPGDTPEAADGLSGAAGTPADANGGGFFDDSAVATLAEQGDGEAAASSAPF